MTELGTGGEFLEATVMLTEAAVSMKDSIKPISQQNLKPPSSSSNFDLLFFTYHIRCYRKVGSIIA
jgi:hypothetical protein